MALDRFKLELIKSEFKSALDAYEREFERACQALPARALPNAGESSARRAIGDRRRLLELRKAELESIRGEFEGLERSWAPTVEPPTAGFPERWKRDLSAREAELARSREALEERWRRLGGRKPEAESAAVPPPAVVAPIPEPPPPPAPVEDPYPQPAEAAPIEEPVVLAPVEPPPPPPPPIVRPEPEEIAAPAPQPAEPVGWDTEGKEELKDWPSMSERAAPEAPAPEIVRPARKGPSLREILLKRAAEASHKPAPAASAPEPEVSEPAVPKPAVPETAAESPRSESPTDEDLDFHRAELEKALQKLRDAQKGLI